MRCPDHIRISNIDRGFIFFSVWQYTYIINYFAHWYLCWYELSKWYRKFIFAGLYQQNQVSYFIMYQKWRLYVWFKNHCWITMKTNLSQTCLFDSRIVYRNGLSCCRVAFRHMFIWSIKYICNLQEMVDTLDKKS